MTNKQKESYKDTDALRRIFDQLKGRKFRLDCGHHVTFGHNLGNNITIYNDNKRLKIIFTQCGY